jgi:DNA-binding GntR family transcriptional regulator
LSGRLTITPHRSLSEVVYEKLRDAIADGELKPGQRLIQAELAERMGVSRIPVREALHRLSKEGLVDLAPHRGAIVRRPSMRELQDVLWATQVLIRAAMVQVAALATDEDITTLEHIHRRLIQAAAAGRTADVVELNRRFDLGLFHAARLAKLFECLEMLGGFFPQGNQLSVLSRGSSALAEHEDILTALRARDGARLVAVAERHILNNAHSVLDGAGKDGDRDDRAAI